jgi:hypothetical protein
MEKMAMLRAELINSCSHEKVAEAAVLSIGGEFRDRVALHARASNFSTGQFAALCVRRFAQEAHENDWEALSAVIAGCDTPILHWLRWLVEAMLDDELPSERQSRSAALQTRRGGILREGRALEMPCA